MQCAFCGKLSVHKFCNEICENKQNIFENKEFKTFKSFKEASEYFEVEN